MILFKRKKQRELRTKLIALLQPVLDERVKAEDFFLSGKNLTVWEDECHKLSLGSHRGAKGNPSFKEVTPR